MKPRKLARIRKKENIIEALTSSSKTSSFVKSLTLEKSNCDTKKLSNDSGSQSQAAYNLKTDVFQN